MVEWKLGEEHHAYGKVAAMGVREGEAYRMFVKDGSVSLIPLACLLEDKKIDVSPFFFLKESQEDRISQAGKRELDEEKIKNYVVCLLSSFGVTYSEEKIKKYISLIKARKEKEKEPYVRKKNHDNLYAEVCRGLKNEWRLLDDAKATVGLTYTYLIIIGEGCQTQKEVSDRFRLLISKKTTGQTVSIYYNLFYHFVGLSKEIDWKKRLKERGY